MYARDRDPCIDQAFARRSMGGSRSDRGVFSRMPSHLFKRAWVLGGFMHVSHEIGYDPDERPGPACVGTTDASMPLLHNLVPSSAQEDKSCLRDADGGWLPIAHPRSYEISAQDPG